MLKQTMLVMSALLVVSGCTSVADDEVRAERSEYREWLKTVHNEEKFNNVVFEDYDLERQISFLIPTLQTIQSNLPENRFEVDLGEFENTNWFYAKCSENVDADNNILPEKLPKPIIGSHVEPVVNGYASETQVRNIAETLNVEPAVKMLDTHVLSGSDVLPPYPMKEIIITETVNDFIITLTWNNSWNTYLWEGFYEIADPGRWNFDEYAYPDSTYAPYRLTVDYVKPCEPVE